MFYLLTGDLSELGDWALKVDWLCHNFAVYKNWVRWYLVLLIKEQRLLIHQIYVYIWLFSPIDFTVFSSISGGCANLERHLILLLKLLRSQLCACQLLLGWFVHHGRLFLDWRLNHRHQGLSSGLGFGACIRPVLYGWNYRIGPTMPPLFLSSFDLNLVNLLWEIVIKVNVIVVETHVEVKPFLHLFLFLSKYFIWLFN